MNKFENLIIQKVIIHQIYKRENKNIIIPPFFNNECDSLEEDAKEILKQRITKAMSHKSHAIQMEVGDDSEESVFKYMSDFWLTDDSDENFVEISKVLTRRLAEKQTSISYPGGVVVVVKGTVQEINKPFIAVIKAEKQNGFTAEEMEGKMILKYFSDLLLTPHQKLQKMGFFINNAVAGRKIEKKDVDVFLFDTNTNSSSGKTNYFYNDFLGLGFRRDSNILTKNFFNTTKDFIKIHEGFDTNMKIKLRTALTSYLKFNVSMYVNVNDFAEEYIKDASAKDAYIKYSESKDVPINNIRKDLNLILKDLKNRQFNFINNIKLKVPSDDFNDFIQINESEGGDTHIIVKGRFINEE